MKISSSKGSWASGSGGQMASRELALVSCAGPDSTPGPGSVVAAAYVLSRDKPITARRQRRVVAVLVVIVNPRYCSALLRPRQQLCRAGTMIPDLHVEESPAQHT